MAWTRSVNRSTDATPRPSRLAAANVTAGNCRTMATFRTAFSMSAIQPGHTHMALASVAALQYNSSTSSPRPAGSLSIPPQMVTPPLLPLPLPWPTKRPPCSPCMLVLRLWLRRPIHNSITSRHSPGISGGRAPRDCSSAARRMSSNRF